MSGSVASSRSYNLLTKVYQKLTILPAMYVCIFHLTPKCQKESVATIMYVPDSPICLSPAGLSFFAILLATYLMLIEPSKGVFANMLPALLPDTESEIYASVKKNYELLKIVDSPVHVYCSVPIPSHKLCFF